MTTATINLPGVAELVSTGPGDDAAATTPNMRRVMAKFSDDVPPISFLWAPNEDFSDTTNEGLIVDQLQNLIDGTADRLGVRSQAARYLAGMLAMRKSIKEPPA